MPGGPTPTHRCTPTTGPQMTGRNAMDRTCSCVGAPPWPSGGRPWLGTPTLSNVRDVEVEIGWHRFQIGMVAGDEDALENTRRRRAIVKPACGPYRTRSCSRWYRSAFLLAAERSPTQTVAIVVAGSPFPPLTVQGRNPERRKESTAISGKPLHQMSNLSHMRVHKPSQCDPETGEQVKRPMMWSSIPHL